jgi:hypothetical protein
MKALLSSLLMCFLEFNSKRLACERGTTKHLPRQQHMSTVIMQKYKIIVARVLLCLMLDTPVSGWSTFIPFGVITFNVRGCFFGSLFFIIFELT